jgi:hypothetical protein
MNWSPGKTGGRELPLTPLFSGARWHRHATAVGLAAGLSCFQPSRARAEDHFDYRFEHYQEDDKRIKVLTHSGLFEGKLSKDVSIRGEIVYDAISGASPTGAPPPSTIHFVPPSEGGPSGPFKDTVPLAELEDIRYAISFETPVTLGRHRITPQFSYSEEHDYLSLGAALNYSIDLNEKNTTLNAGWSHNWDTIRPKGFLFEQDHKNSDDVMIGVNQLLGPKTVLTVNLTYGNSRGYLNDQYKGVLFDSDTQLDPLYPALTAENRPRNRDRYIGYFALTQSVVPLNASIEGSYRFFHDTYNINAHTISLAWFQKFGRYVVLSPAFRYYRQSEADFYATRFPDSSNRPEFYSADYRLSELDTFSIGAMLTVRVLKELSFDAGYKRYVMNGLDGVTSQSAYPSANVFTIGARAWF